MRHDAKRAKVYAAAAPGVVRLIYGLPMLVFVASWRRSAVAAGIVSVGGALIAPTPASTLAPAGPADFHATTVSSNQINLIWNAASNAISYNVKRSTVSDGFYAVVATNVTATTYHDTGLLPGTTYYYTVSAVNHGGTANIAETSGVTGSALRFRLIISTDFPPTNVIPGGAGYGPANLRSDPDDVQSMVRFLLYANDFDIEGLVASAGTFANIANKTNILNMLDLYDRVYRNLIQHDLRYPTAGRLREVTWQGRDGAWGKPFNGIVGAGKDSEASDAIINVVDKPDPRPIWFCFWGGSRELAQAIWKVQHTRNPAELERFLSRLRLYLIGKQDGSAQWLLDNFPNLFVILSEKNYMGMFAQNSELGNLNWLNAHIRQGHGPLGAIYPQSGFNPASPGQQEGDTPSFLYLVSAMHGINDPEKPDEESWGGKFVRPDPSRDHWFDDPAGAQTVSRWRPQVQAEFAFRADWMLDDAK